MAYQNRVDPWGVIFATPARGIFMGNRGGELHNERCEIVRQHVGRRWITCVLEFRGRYRRVMAPGHYTQLFFLDEAVAFAAGHRPCAECRRERFNAFTAAWKRRAGMDAEAVARAAEIDAELHRHRIDRSKSKVTYEAVLGELPNGCFVEIGGEAYLVWNEALLLWSQARYIRKERLRAGERVRILTPRPVVECLGQGYRPSVHESAGEMD